jgi:hypothetical protein
MRLLQAKTFTAKEGDSNGSSGDGRTAPQNGIIFLRSHLRAVAVAEILDAGAARCE